MTPMVDRQPENPRACCIRCATWVCHECWDWHRNGASINYPQYCHKCGGIEGGFIAVRHRKPHGEMVIPRPIPLRLPQTGDEINDLYFYL
jgi:hypothetical protein